MFLGARMVLFMIPFMDKHLLTSRDGENTAMNLLNIRVYTNNH